MPALEPVLNTLDNNLDKSLARLFDLLKIKSISTDPGFKAECRKAAEWLVADLKSVGFEASVRDTPGPASHGASHPHSQNQACEPGDAGDRKQHAKAPTGHDPARGHPQGASSLQPHPNRGHRDPGEQEEPQV